MRRVFQLAAIAAALTIGARSATAAAETPPRATASVIALSVVPAAGRAEVVVAIDGAVDVIDFTLDSPRRIVVDFRGATLGMPARFYDKVSRGGIINVRVAQTKPDIVRLVLDLDGPHEYSVVRGEKDVRIAVSGPDQFAAWHLGSAGRNVAASAAAVPPEAHRAQITMAESRAEQQAEPKLAQMKVAAPKPEPMFEQPRITVTYVDIDIREIIGGFATFANKTIVIGSTVTGKVPFMEIKDKPWDVALAAVLSSLNLTAVEDSSGIITVDSYANLSARQSQEPLVSQIVPVNYAKAATLATTITSLLGAGCGKGAAPSGAAGAAAAAGAGAAAAPPALAFRSAAAAAAATLPAFECPLNMRVCENSPSLWPTMFSEM
jgi:type IV pilus assembly protein PilQ